MNVSTILSLIVAILKELSHDIFSNLTAYKITFEGNLKIIVSYEKKTLVKEIIINHKGTRMVKDGEDLKYGLRTTNLKNLGLTFQDAQTMTWLI